MDEAGQQTSYAIKGDGTNLGTYPIYSNLKYTQSNDGTYYIVSGLGSCTDAEIVIPSTHKG